MERRKIAILGAAGRDFHNFNVHFRDNPLYEVKAFTATQIPGIGGRRYPPGLSGPLYPDGIPIYEESELERLIQSMGLDECVFSYSDISYSYVMRLSSRVMAAGSSFSILGPSDTQLRSSKPVIAVCAVRTGCGKSQTSRRILELLRQRAVRVAVLRHPMPYGDFSRQASQRFGSIEDLAGNDCTIEEMEEYEPYLSLGHPVFAGVDYAHVLSAAEKEADIILWDGGNNDFPFIRPDLFVTVVDPLRAGDEIGYFPGEATLRMADVVVINKIDSADPASIQLVRTHIDEVNAKARVIDAASPIRVEGFKGKPGVGAEYIKGRDMLCVEDGPTLTHGKMKFGAAVVAATRYGAKTIVDPRPYAVGSMAATYSRYPEIGRLLPAMGYGAEQIRDLESTIRATPCDGVLIGTPIDLSRILAIDKPHARVRYDLQEIGTPTLKDVLDDFMTSRSMLFNT